MVDVEDRLAQQLRNVQHPDLGRHVRRAQRQGVGHRDLVDGRLLEALERQKLADNTLIMVSSDNGAAGRTYAPLRGAKTSIYEGGHREPFLARWPGKIKPGTISNGIQNHEDVFATLAAAAGEPRLGEELLKGKKIGAATYKVHLDGYDNLDHWTGKSERSARHEIFYYDETDLMALRVDGYKMHIGVKKEGSWWNEKYYPSIPYLVNLQMDPLEKMTQESDEWSPAAHRFMMQKLWALNASGPFIAAHLKSIMEYPPSQGADTLSIKKALEEVQAKMEKAAAGHSK